MGKKHLWLVLAAAVAAAGCKKAATGGGEGEKMQTTVRFHYTLTVEGRKMESTVGKEPLTTVLGAGQIIPGLDDALRTMKPGEKRSVTVGPEKGYGSYRQEGIQKVPRSSFKDMPGLKPGVMVSGQGNGRTFQALVKALDEKEVTLDLNHPLAGKTLTFDVEIVSVSGG